MAKKLGPPLALIPNFVFLIATAVCAQETAPVVGTGKTVALEYTMSLKDGTVVNSNVGREPLEYMPGRGQLFPRLEEALSGMAVDDEKTVKLKPEDAYGVANPEAVRKVPREKLPEEALKPGAELVIPGLQWPVLVRDVGPDSVVLDLNHPLAGKTLIFKLRVLSIS